MARVETISHNIKQFQREGEKAIREYDLTKYGQPKKVVLLRPKKVEDSRIPQIK